MDTRTKEMVTCFACNVELPLVQSFVVTATHLHKSPYSCNYTAYCRPYVYASRRARVYRPPQVDLHACAVCANSGEVMSKIEQHYLLELALHPVESNDSSSDDEFDTADEDTVD